MKAPTERRASLPGLECLLKGSTQASVLGGTHPSSRVRSRTAVHYHSFCTFPHLCALCCQTAASFLLLSPGGGAASNMDPDGALMKFLSLFIAPPRKPSLHNPLCALRVICPLTGARHLRSEWCRRAPAVWCNPPTHCGQQNNK